MSETQRYKNLMTIAEAAGYLHISESSIRLYLRQGKIEAVRLPWKRTRYIRRSVVLSLLEPARGVDQEK